MAWIVLHHRELWFYWTIEFCSSEGWMLWRRQLIVNFQWACNIIPMFWQRYKMKKFQMKKEGFRRVRRDVKQLTCVPVKLLTKCNDWKCWSKENVCCGSKNPGEFTGITNNQSWQSPHAYFISCITDSNKQTCKQTMLTEMRTDSNKCCSECSIARENNTRHIFIKKPLLLFLFAQEEELKRT